jgi:hypothetical protein
MNKIEEAPHVPEFRNGNELEVVMWSWRDGSVHAEMYLASFFDEDGEHKLVCHLDSGTTRFQSACGRKYWGKSSATGLGHPHNVNCEECRAILAGLHFVPKGA